MKLIFDRALSDRCKAALAIALLWYLPTLSQAGVIDTVSIEDSENPATIHIDFNIPLQYINHAPEREGDELEIQFRRIRSDFFSQESENSRQQTVTPSPSRYVPLIDAHYQTVGTERGLLRLRFSRKVSYTVYPGADRRHILIKVVTTNNPIKHRNQAIRKIPKTARGKHSRRAFTLAQHYVVNLESFLQGKNQPPLKAIPDLNKYVTYTTRFPIEGRVWNRLRVGFFDTRLQAERYRKKLLGLYSGAWVAYASSKEINAALKQVDLLATPMKAPVRMPRPTLPPTPDEKIFTLMEEARKSIAKNNIRHAIQLYTKVLRYPQNQYTRDALEYLGLARERNRQYAHAIREYQRYLKLYPKGEGAARVKQRLAGLTTARQQPRQLSSGRQRAKRSHPWNIYGGISQFFRRDESSTDASGSLVTQSSLSNDLDITARKRSNKYDIQSRFTGSYLHDFLSNGPGDNTSISSLYVDVNQKQYGLSARLGRQSRNTGGVLGRFDGLLLGYRVNDWLTVNGVAGFPVFSTRDTLKTGRHLYGISTDLGTFANAWDFEAFFIEQQNEGILDRRAIGGEARYFDPVRSLLSFVDYDISFASLNTLIVLGTWTLPDRTTINASVDYRNSPILTTTNALQGQTLPTLDQLLNKFTEKQIRKLAEDRTADVVTVSLGASHPLNEKLQLNGDVTVSRLSGTNTSGGVDAIPGTGNEYFYNLQLIGSNLIKSGDISVFGVRYSDTSTSTITSLTLDTRYPIHTVWRINPRFRLDYRNNSNNDSTQWTAAPSLRIDYRWHKHYRLEAEAGGELSTQDLSTTTQNSSSYFFSLGYRADF